MVNSKHILGIDCGQTALKICVFNTEGKELSSVSAPTGAYYTEDGITAELDMNLLWQNVQRLLQQITATLPSDSIAAIGVSGHGNGVYAVDRQGKAFMPAILSTDLRASPVITDWQETGRAEAIRRKILCPPWAGQPVPILVHLKKTEPARYQAIGSVLSCADWINYCLCGVLSSDYGSLGTCGLIDQKTKQTDAALCEAYGLPELADLLPPAYAAGSLIGCVTEKAAAETGLAVGTAVTAGNFDVNACCIGGGAVLPDRYSVTAGTWSINAAFSEAPVISDRLFSCNLYADGAQYINIESSPTSAINLEVFLSRHPDLTPRACDELVENTDWHTNPEALYLPYVKPLPTMPFLKGGFSQQAEAAPLPEKLRILYEGVAMGHRYHLENLKAAGIHRPVVRMTGGATRSAVWMQIFADILGHPIELPDGHSAGALGAAICAGTAAGLYESIDAACRSMIAVRKTVYPDPARSHFYQQKFEAFLNAIAAQAAEH
ncbi:MAG: carbohydrate kinase [Ruminococcaceae bacterium]|nr:carbohydrate kinase [Oscillospiraceae bacterium]